MNIKITYNWLLEYLDTDADPYEIQKYLSLCGPGVERVDKVGNDYVFDIEITSNRVDMASVFGIAQEAQAILPRFGKKAKLKQNPLTELRFKWSEKFNGKSLPLTLKVEDKKFASRLITVVLSDVTIKPSDKLIKERLEMCGERSLNNVIDISNYMRIALGQPCHIFDYDEIKQHTMIVRESKKGEKIETLDKETVTLPGMDIVIADGEGNLIDQPGIMGGFNSSVQKNTKNIVLFVPVFNGSMVRRTAMLTGKRSNAVAYFEKNLDDDRAESATIYSLNLLRQIAGAKQMSEIKDYHPTLSKKRSIEIEHSFIENRMGISIKPEECKKILENLGFHTSFNARSTIFKVDVPLIRLRDIVIPEDIVEEIARIYGYHNLPNNLPPMVYIQQPKEMEQLFDIQRRIKLFLKHTGLHESMNYSMVSKELIENMNLEMKHHLRLANTISEELQYMRTSLLPSLVKNIKENQGKKDVLRFFEIAKVYYPQEKELPKEIYKVAMATNTSFMDLKGIVGALLNELKIEGYELGQSKIHIFSKNEVVDFSLNGSVFGSIGRLSTKLQHQNGLNSGVYLASLDLLSLIAHSKIISQYKPINPYATVKLDLNVKTGKQNYEDIKKVSYSTSKLLEKMELVDVYKDTLNIRFYFSSTKNNLTEVEAQKELEKIKGLLG